MNNLIWKVIKFITILTITVLLVTNPGGDKYENYASEELTKYLKQDVCEEVTQKVGKSLRTPCQILIDTAQPQIKATISKNTQQQNFLLFSLYQTNLSLPSITPEYYFSTIGIFERFFTYETDTNE